METRGGTQEAPNKLPLGVQPLGDVSTQSSPNHAPVEGDSWPAQQENYGGVSIGSPAAGGLGLRPAGGAWSPMQENYGGVSIAGAVTDPTVGPDGT